MLRHDTWRNKFVVVNFSLLCEHSDVESYVHTVIRNYLWPDNFPAPAKYGRRQAINYPRQLEERSGEMAAEARFIQEYLVYRPQLLGQLVTKLEHRIKLRQNARSFLRHLGQGHAHITIYSPMVIGYNVIKKIILRDVDCKQAAKISYKTNGLARTHTGQWTSWYKFPAPAKRLAKLQYHGITETTYLLSDQLEDSRQMIQLFPRCLSAGACDPTDASMRREWEKIAEKICTRAEIFKHCLTWH